MQSEKPPRNMMIWAELVKLISVLAQYVDPNSKILSLKCKASSAYGKTGEYSNICVHIYTHMTCI